MQFDPLDRLIDVGEQGLEQIAWRRTRIRAGAAPRHGRSARCRPAADAPATRTRAGSRPARRRRARARPGSARARSAAPTAAARPARRTASRRGRATRGAATPGRSPRVRRSESTAAPRPASRSRGQLAIAREVRLRHPLEREALAARAHGRRAARSDATFAIAAAICATSSTMKPVRPCFDDLGQGAGAIRDHRRAGGDRLHGHQRRGLARLARARGRSAPAPSRRFLRRPPTGADPAAVAIEVRHDAARADSAGARDTGTPRRRSAAARRRAGTRRSRRRSLFPGRSGRGSSAKPRLRAGTPRGRRRFRSAASSRRAPAGALRAWLAETGCSVGARTARRERRGAVPVERQVQRRQHRRPGRRQVRREIDAVQMDDVGIVERDRLAAGCSRTSPWMRSAPGIVDLASRRRHGRAARPRRASRPARSRSSDVRPRPGRDRAAPGPARRRRPGRR